MILFAVILTFLFLMDYFIFYLKIAKGWDLISKNKFEESAEIRTVSIVIAARNEAKTIAGLLTDIQNQNVSLLDLEVIVVNDHSEDQTATLVKNSFPNVKLLELEEEKKGKKAALTKGILEATGAIILTTDSDCRMSPTWIQELIKPFHNSKINLVSGPVLITNPNSVVSLFQYFEFNGLVSIGAGLQGIKKPSLANGANLAFRLNVWKEIGGYATHANIGSGDDELFLMEVEKKYPQSVAFNPNKAAAVYTEAQHTWGALIQQRLRWASKHRYYTNDTLKILLFRLFLFHTWLLLLIVLSFFNSALILVLIFGWIAKDLIENIVLKKSFFTWDLPFLIWKKMLLQPTQWFLVATIGFGANVKRTYTWKGRKQR